MRDLEIAFEELANTSLDLNSYSGQLQSVAFDIFTADTFIAGIADKIISGDLVNDDDKSILAKPLIVNEIFWVTNNGQTVDIKDDKLLLDLASKVETLRQICMKGFG